MKSRWSIIDDQRFHKLACNIAYGENAYVLAFISSPKWNLNVSCRPIYSNLCFAHSLSFHYFPDIKWRTSCFFSHCFWLFAEIISVILWIPILKWNEVFFDAVFFSGNLIYRLSSDVMCEKGESSNINTVHNKCRGWSRQV